MTKTKSASVSVISDQVPTATGYPRTEWTTVTPEMAAAWLKNYNHNNRSIRRDHVAKLAADMRDGRWVGRNGEAIRFDGEGRLVDGQHRLAACVEAAVPFETLVVAGIDPSAYSTIGIGSAKTLGDFLGPVHGEKNVTLLSGVLRLVFEWERGGLEKSMRHRSGGASIAQLQELLSRRPTIRDSVSWVVGSSQKGEIRFLPTTFAAFLHYCATQRGHGQAVEEFLTKLTRGLGLTDTDPVYHLRRYLMAQRTSSPGRKVLRRAHVLALLIKAWNLTLNGKPVKNLKIQIGEEFPKL